MTLVRVEPTPLMFLMPLTSALNNMAILPIHCKINIIDYGSKYYIQVFKYRPKFLYLSFNKMAGVVLDPTPSK